LLAELIVQAAWLGVGVDTFAHTLEPERIHQLLNIPVLLKELKEDPKRDKLLSAPHDNMLR